MLRLFGFIQTIQTTLEFIATNSVLLGATNTLLAASALFFVWLDKDHIRNIHFNSEAFTVTDQFFHPTPHFGHQKRVFQRQALALRTLPNLLESLLFEFDDSANGLL